MTLGGRVRREAGILCLRAAALAARVPGCYGLAVTLVTVAIFVLPDECRKVVAVKLQWEAAREARAQEEQDAGVERSAVGARAKRAG